MFGVRGFKVLLHRPPVGTAPQSCLSVGLRHCPDLGLTVLVLLERYTVFVRV